MAGNILQRIQELREAYEKKLVEYSTYSTCDKCAVTFLSPINYRRHVRVHRGSLNAHKESQKNRGLLAAFWDKLTLKQVKEILAFDDVMLKDIPASSVINCLVSSLRKSGTSTQPQSYVEVGNMLLDFVQAKPSTLPLPSKALFTLLDAASERTFLCAGTAESLQKYIFGGETDIIGLDLKNLIATTSFLFEQKLVKAWVEDKEAETLRLQKLLVEEEEAEQKRQAALLEKKMQKKLRQKEHKEKEQFHGGNADSAINVIAADRPTSAEASERSTPSDSSSHAPLLPTESLKLQRQESDEDIEAQFDSYGEPVNQWDSQSIACLTPPNVWMQKCAKCSREFCSPINYKRHVWVHRRSFNIDKVSHKNRKLLAGFWDMLSFHQVKEILAFDNVMLKETTGSSIINCLVSSLCKPGVSALPHVYMNAGSALLDIIQAKPSKLPISSHELFSILDDASERTFLCTGTDESLQGYVFDGETATISHDLKNLVASTSFLFEQQLVKAWVVDKDAEALRRKKLKQEEAEQKRQAMLLEIKIKNKLRRKKQKVKEQFRGGNADSNANSQTSAEASKPSPPSRSSSNTPVLCTNLDSHPESLQPQRKEPNEDIEAQLDSNSEPVNHGDSQTAEHPSWPRVTPLKVQMQKCEKCSWEFCSPVNYRRHVQVHHQFSNVDKEPHGTRDSLAAFWDKLSFEEVKEILTFDDAMLKDIIQAKPSGPLISSQELFSILDEASERTFLCAGTAESSQKHIFDGETAKNNLDLKNLVATISFLFEQKLMKAWVAFKDAEALRGQKLLVEEEEAERKRRAVLLEKGKQKMLYQNNQEVKEQLYGGKSDSVVVVVAKRPTSAEVSEPSPHSASSSKTPDLPTDLDSLLESLQPQRKELDEDVEAQFDSNSGHKIRSSEDQNLLNLKKVWTRKFKMDSDRDSQKPPSRGETSNRIKETKSIPPVGRGDEDSEQHVMLENVNDQILSGERSRESQPTQSYDFDNRENYNALPNEHPRDGSCPLCSNLDDQMKCLLYKQIIDLVFSSYEPPGSL